MNGFRRAASDARLPAHGACCAGLTMERMPVGAFLCGAGGEPSRSRPVTVWAPACQVAQAAPEPSTEPGGAGPPRSLCRPSAAGKGGRHPCMPPCAGVDSGRGHGARSSPQRWRHLCRISAARGAPALTPAEDRDRLEMIRLRWLYHVRSLCDARGMPLRRSLERCRALGNMRMLLNATAARFCRSHLACTAEIIARSPPSAPPSLPHSLNPLELLETLSKGLEEQNPARRIARWGLRLHMDPFRGGNGYVLGAPRAAHHDAKRAGAHPGVRATHSRGDEHTLPLTLSIFLSTQDWSRGDEGLGGGVL